MKELQIKPQSTNIEVSVKQQKQKEHQFLNSIVPYNGHKIWKINKETLEVSEAKFVMASYNLYGENKKEIIVKDGYAYVAALNKKNALKKYKQGVDGGMKLGKEKLNIY